MRTATPVFVALLALFVTSGAVCHGQDETAKGYAFVEALLPERAPFVGEAFTVRLRAGVDVDVLEGNLVQLFRRALDIPVQLDHPWFEGVPGGVPGGLTALGPPAPPTGSGDTFVALGAEPAAAVRSLERGRDGRRFTVVEFERTFLATEPATFVCPAPRLLFAYALEFRDDLVAGRVPLDRHDAFVLGAASELAVRGVPEAGRPFSFTGAVGDLTLRASAEPTRLRIGETARLVVTIDSAAVPATYALPRIERVAGFDLRSRTEDLEGSQRRVTLELVATAAGRHTVPPIELAAFDPTAERYVEHRTAPLVLEVVGDAASPQPPPGASEPGKRGPRPFVIALGALAALAFALRRRRRSSAN